MKYLVPDYYRQFQCIGGSCSNLCCKRTWTIDIDDDSYCRYMALEGDYAQKVKDSIEEFDNGRHRFKLKADHSCPLLTEDGLCGLYIELGKEQMCRTCATYPRKYNHYGDMTESNLRLSCPEACRLLLSHKDPLSFIYTEDDYEFSLDVNQKLLNGLILARSVSIDIMQLRVLPLWKRVLLTSMMTSQIQQLIDRQIYDFAEVLYDYSDPSLFEEKLAPFEELGGARFAGERLALTKYFYQIIHVLFRGDDILPFKALYEKYLTSQSSFAELEREFDEFFKENTYQYENFFVYWLFQYYLCPLENKNLYQSIFLMVFNYYAIKILYILVWSDQGKQLSLSEQTNIVSHLSSHIEHSPGTLNSLYEFFHKKGFDTLTCLALLVQS